jgi:hypothetical protein
VYAYDKYPTDSIRPYNYTWNSGLFDAESIAIAYSDNQNNHGTYHINSQVYYCDIVYLLKNQTSFTTYTVVNDSEKYIRIPYEYESTSFRITPSSNLIAFTYSTNTYESGSLNVLAITSTGTATSSLATKLENIYNEYSDIYVKPVGDYVMYNYYTPSIDLTTYTMVKSATVKDSVNINGYATYGGVWRMRINSLLLRSWNYPSTRNWYFNTSTNKFVELTNGGSTYSAVKPYYAAHYFNKSTTTNGLNDGNILLGPNGGNISAQNQNNNIRLLKKGTVTGNVTLPDTDGNWFIQLGSEAVFFIYQDMNDSYKYKVNVYDLNLKLVRVVPLLTDNLDDWDIAGKRFWARTYNADPFSTNLYSYYMVSLDGVTYWTNTSSINPIFDDQYWWDYV